MTAAGTWIGQFPGNFVWSNAALVTKGMAPYGAVALGEIDEVCERLRPRQAEPDAWAEEWGAMARRLERVAEAAAAEGRQMTAGNCYLRAGMYYFTAERFVPPGEAKRELGRRALACQHAGLRRRHPGIEFVEVPYEGTTLPALFMRAPGVSGRAPTVVVFDGMDNCKEMSVLFAGLEFAARGMHTLAIDGPGQGESLRLRGLSARHDYEVPGAAAYDFVAGRPDVDPARVVVMGYSFGGYYAARIAAFEPRYAAGVAFAALHWDLAAWQREVKRRHDSDPRTTAQSTFHFRWIMGCADMDAAIEKARQFSLADAAGRIAAPFLIVHAEDDRVVPVDAARRLYEAIGSPRKHLKIFTAADGSTYHAQADNRQVGVDYIADWITATLERRPPMATTETSPVQAGPTPALMKAINAAFNSRDVDRIMEFFAEDCTFLMARGPEPVGRRVHGKAAVRRVLADRFAVIADMRWDHVDAFITGQRAVTVWMVTGTGRDGERLDYRGCDIYEFRGDKILNKDTYWKLVEHADRL
jgi:alpha-beta hydrolase superfamily lysophospholipase/ketosteroid isomerase-like protein